ncbi:MFS transporter [Streptomyces sp. NPDC006879]|uniref:MFS transporter n=1 Tax=Streptomyces sp. NPDC006879 TaxID=3364767 RepID=UPI0036740176
MAAGAGFGDSSPRAPYRPRAVVVAVSLALVLVQMDWFTVNAMIPTMAREFDTTPTNLHWVVSANLLALGTLLVTGGKVGDLWGYRRAVAAGLAGFGAASVVCSLAPDPTWLIVGRIFQGGAAALIFPLAVPTVADAIRGVGKDRAIAVVLAAGALGTAVGPFVGGVFAEHISWRAVFLLNVPLSAVAAVLLLWFVPDSGRRRPRGLGLPSVLLLAAGLSAAMVGLGQSNVWGWNHPATLVSFGLGFSLLALFAAIERRSSIPLFEPRLLRSHSIVLVATSGALVNIMSSVTVVLATFYLQEFQGVSPTIAGSLFLSLSMSTAAASFGAVRLARRWHPESLMGWGMLISAVGIFSLAYAERLGWYAIVLALCGGGFGIGWSLTNVVTAAWAPAGRTGAALGLVLTLITLSGGVAVAAAMTLLEITSHTSYSGNGASNGPAIERLLQLTSLIGLAGGVAMLAVIRARPKPARLS